MSKLIGLALLAGAGWYGWKEGHFDAYLPPEFASPVSVQADPASTPITPASVLASNSITTEENLLRIHDQYVSNYAATVPELTAAMMWQESRGNPRAISSAGARGLMQVMPPTAKFMYDKGYTRLLPTLSNLVTEEGSIYFGTAYMEYLNSIRGTRNWEWFIRAYNAGPGGASKIMAGEPYSAKAIKENNGYYKAVSARWQTLKNRNSRMA